MANPSNSNPAPIGIMGLGAYVPERVMSNDDWAAYVDTSDEWIVERTGIRQRRIAAPSQSTADLAVEAAKVALAEANLAPESIDELIVATDTPEVYIPDTASYLQHRLGLREIPAYDLGGSGCAGFVLALDLARSRAAFGRGSAAPGGKRVLVIGVELLTRLMNWQDRNTCVLFGDAAGAAVIGPLAGGPNSLPSGEQTQGDRDRADRSRRAVLQAEVLAATAGTDGSRAEILTLEAGGTRRPFSAEVLASGAHQNVVMKGREVFREAVRRMSQSARDVVEMAGKGLDDVDLFVPHQANRRIIHAVGKALGMSGDEGEHRVFVNVQDYGNTGSASVPLALWEAQNQGRIKPGDTVLLTAFGAGFHWAAVLLQY